MNRASWNIQRRRVRDSYPSRADRSLPHHRDGSGLAQCPRCSGAGAIDRDHWQPELCTSSTCSLCDGSGTIAAATGDSHE